jgi:hypothetical protein
MIHQYCQTPFYHNRMICLASNGSGGHNLEVITLTPEAANKICLSTNSKIDPKVQQYFLDIECLKKLNS